MDDEVCLYEDSLRTWLNGVCATFSDINEASILSDVEQIRLLGSYLFSLPHDCSLNDVREKLCDHFDFQIMSLEDTLVTIEACLVCAVSPKQPKRAEFVQQIMSMDLSNQKALMQAIKDNLEKYRPSSYSSSTVPAAHQDKPELLCKKCPIHLHEIVKLKESITDLSKKDAEHETVLERELIIISNRLAETELILLDKEDVIARYERDLSKADYKIAELEQKCSKYSLMASEITQLKDQIDILKSKAASADIAEGQVEKLRSRLEEMSQIKSQLKVEVSLHSETHSRLLEFERECESLRHCKTQLEEYRNLFTESEIKVEELKVKYSQKEKELNIERQRNENTSGSQQEHIQQIQHLTDELNATNERLREVERSNGVGEGVSELNPALMMELNRLRVENKDLLERVDASSLDSLEKLQCLLADQRCMSSSLQSKWISCKGALEESQQKNISLSQQFDEITKNFQIYKLQIEESHAMDNEDSCAKQLRSISNKKICTKRNNDSLHLLSLGRQILIQMISDKLDKLNIELSEKESLNSSLLNEKEDLSVRLGQTISESVFALQKERLESQSRRQELEIQLETEITSTKVLSEELEDERVKRRRMEREKRILEGEVQRLRGQLQQEQANGLAGGPVPIVVEEALRELKLMHNELQAKEAKERRFISKSMSDSGNILSDEINSLQSSSTEKTNTNTNGASRVRLSDRVVNSVIGSGNNTSNTQGPVGSYGGYLEQAEMTDRRVEQLSREKRDLIARNLEESKERMELAQKLLLSERENATTKAKLTKLTLELERSERKLAKQNESFGNSCVITRGTDGSLPSSSYLGDENDEMKHFNIVCATNTTGTATSNNELSAKSRRIFRDV